MQATTARTGQGREIIRFSLHSVFDGYTNEAIGIQTSRKLAAEVDAGENSSDAYFGHRQEGQGRELCIFNK